MKMCGFSYCRSTRQWDVLSPVNAGKYNFLKLSSWLMALLKEFAKKLEVPFAIKPKLPWGSTFKCYQGCVLIRSYPKDFAAIDSELRRRGISNVKKVHGVIDSLEPLLGFL